MNRVGWPGILHEFVCDTLRRSMSAGWENKYTSREGHRLSRRLLAFDIKHEDNNAVQDWITERVVEMYRLLISLRKARHHF